MKKTLIIIGCILAFAASIFALNLLGFANTAFFAPKYEGVRRDVMIESRYYSEATVREMYRLKRQYDSAETQDARDTIAAAARHEFSIFPQDRLPSDLRSWQFEIN